MVIPSFDDVMKVSRDISSIAAFPDEDAQGLYDCCARVPEGGCVIETGCQLGRSSSIILQLARAIGFHSIHIDPWTQQSGWMKDWMETMYRVGGEQEHAFTVMCMRTAQAAWLLSQIGQIDLAFIDGDHEREGVEMDLKLIANKIKPGGLLACHDFTNDELLGVRQAVIPYVATGWDTVGVYGSLGVWGKR